MKFSTIYHNIYKDKWYIDFITGTHFTTKMFDVGVIMYPFHMLYVGLTNLC